MRITRSLFVCGLEKRSNCNEAKLAEEITKEIYTGVRVCVVVVVVVA